MERAEASQVESSNGVHIPEDIIARISRVVLSSVSIDTELIYETIKNCWEENHYMVRFVARLPSPCLPVVRQFIYLESIQLLFVDVLLLLLLLLLWLMFRYTKGLPSYGHCFGACPFKTHMSVVVVLLRR